MTDRKPDDLYDALRERLTGYGQEPPAHLWAGIRAKLPPPVAQPQLRRRRRWSPVVLLGLLLTVVSGAGWHWWHTAGPGQPAASRPALATTALPAATNEATITANSPGPAGQGSTGQGSASQSAATRAAKTGLNESGVAASASTASETGVAGAPGSRLASSPSAAATRSAARKRKSVLSSSGGTTAGLYARNSAAVGAALRGAALPGRAGAAGIIDSPAASIQPPAAQQGIQTRPGLAANEAYSSLSQLDHKLTAANKEAGISPTASGTAEEANGLQNSTVNAIGEAATAEVAAIPTVLLIPRPVAVLAPAESLPILQLSSDTLPVLPVIAARRWAVQMLAGPLLTHRQLGSGTAESFNPFPNVPATHYLGSRTASNQLAQQEQASTGFGAQVQAQRMVNGRWTVSAGLGYQEYASHTTYASYASISSGPRPNSSPPSPPAAVLYTHRDTYRFLSVPVRLGYALGRAGGRFRYGVLAGADAAFYLGGTSAGTTEAPRHWSSSRNSPYRPVSLSLSTGLDLRYRVASRLELLAQPTATHFITSLPRVESGLTPRYLVGIGALFGVSYELR